MAKGQKKSNREAKKPKATKKPDSGNSASPFQQTTKPAPVKGGSK
jgi:hypothetical protein